MNDIRDNFKELTHKILDHESGNPVPVGLNDDAETPSAPMPVQRRRDVWLRHLREQRAIARALRPHRRPHDDRDIQNISLEDKNEKKDVSYACLDELESEVEARYVSRPMSRPSAFVSLMGLNNLPRETSREYPRIPSPLIKEAQEYEMDRLREETELTNQLESALSPSSTRKYSKSFNA
jgi:hypothetical protein